MEASPAAVMACRLGRNVGGPPEEKSGSSTVMFTGSASTRRKLALISLEADWVLSVRLGMWIPV